jgi:hypothetical protein
MVRNGCWLQWTGFLLIKPSKVWKNDCGAVKAQFWLEISELLLIMDSLILMLELKTLDFRNI